jgi:hypothetical protein
MLLVMLLARLRKKASEDGQGADTLRIRLETYVR